jgi:DNA-binding SARP family transcriptional activator
VVTVEFRVLGQVEVRVGGGSIDVGHARQRCVLAVLLVEANRPVSPDQLLDRVWAGRDPQRARNTLSGYISRLRRALTAVAGAALAWHPSGYMLTVDPLAVDLHRFGHLVELAGTTTDSDEALALLNEALGSWRGEAFAGLDTPWLHEVRAAWDARRFAAELERNDLALARGQHARLLAELVERSAVNPLDERLAGQLMLALCRSGRQADALVRYDRIRRALVEELGADPGPPLRELHRRVLANDPTLLATEVPASPARAAPARPAVPRQLPAPLRLFVGRARDIAALDALADAALTAPAAVVVSAISGMAGVGKTALAVFWAHRVAARFADGQLYLNLRGFDPSGSPMTPDEAVRAFLDALGVPPPRAPVGIDAQVGLYRSLLAGRRMLIVLDNARDAGQVRPLLPGVTGCMVAITSRNQLAGLLVTDGAHPLNLDLLSETESHDLLAARIGQRRVAAESEAVSEVVARCARLPLALSIVAARAAVHPTFPLAGIATELGRARHSLASLTSGDTASDIRAVFSWSYRTLSTAAARLFRLLGLHAGPEISAAAAAGLAGLPQPRARALLAELVRSHLVVEPTFGRYVLHDLLRDYAGQLAQLHDSDRRRRDAVHRVLDHYVHTANIAAHRQHPYRDAVPLPEPRPGVTPEDVPDHDAAVAWFTTEHAVLLAAIDHAAAAGFDHHAWRLAWAMWTYLERRGHWHDIGAVGRTALAAARRTGDPAAQAPIHRMLAKTGIMSGEYAEARAHLELAIELYEQVGNRVGQAHTHHNISYVFEQEGRHADALDHAERSLHLYRMADHRYGTAQALAAVGWYHALLGNHRQALPICHESLALRKELGDRVGQAIVLHSLGYVEQHLGDHRQAAGWYEAALDVFRESGYRALEADTLVGLGDTHDAAGDPRAAAVAWRQGLAILEELDLPTAGQVRDRLGRPPRSTTRTAG